MAPVEPPQLRFLSQSANLLASSSPSTAAHLLTAHTGLLHKEGKSLNARQHKHHCAGCGGLRDQKSLCSQTTKIKYRSKPQALATVYKCLRCNQRAVIPSKRPASKAAARIAPSSATALAAATAANAASPHPETSIPKSSMQQIPPSTGPGPSEKSGDNVNSKRRAKARKQGGLQALLASKKSTQPSLDLLDFLHL
ncbi:hypothetical protein N7532_004982 [Penicillium argentinense]|uniref:Uncharacterized protein n=1 Tax=Penicillium argentinense TaxID=1131581 RepID=A0A9W9K9X5_9EURO|nr:uncharacterized protein N7532_004982 [Penicillium argentinense]KAJ5097981.1 hypothetical protein N7532_004982 [Penicillium argentinense]